LYRIWQRPWIAEQGFPVAPTLEICPLDQIPASIVDRFHEAWSAAPSDFVEFRFVHAVEVPVEKALTAVSVAADGRCLAQITRVHGGRAEVMSASFTTATRPGTMLVTGNARHYWDPPVAVKTQHCLGASMVSLCERHDRWLTRFPPASLIRCAPDEGLTVLKHMSRILTESYVQRGLYVIRPADHPASEV
jgi:hypothetical protein